MTVNTLGIRMSPTNTAPLIFYHQHSTIRIRRIQAPGSGRHDKLNYEKAASAAYFFAAVIIVSCVVVAFLNEHINGNTMCIILYREDRLYCTFGWPKQSDELPLSSPTLAPGKTIVQTTARNVLVDRRQSNGQTWPLYILATTQTNPYASVNCMTAIAYAVSFVETFSALVLMIALLYRLLLRSVQKEIAVLCHGIRCMPSFYR